MKTWKREYDAIVARACLGVECRIIYGTSAIDVRDVIDPAGASIPSYNTDEAACLQAAAAARAKGLIQAWSISEGPHGYNACAVRFDGTAVRTGSPVLADAWSACLLDICQRRN